MPDETPAMQIPRARFTVRRMMVAVAIVGVLLAVGELMRRRAVYLDRAERYQSMAKPRFGWTPPFDANEAEVRKAIAEFRATREADLNRPEVQRWLRLARKYDHAARYPWLPVAPDPPEPE
jgi:hypothetical protein